MVKYLSCSSIVEESPKELEVFVSVEIILQLHRYRFQSIVQKPDGKEKKRKVVQKQKTETEGERRQESQP